MVWLVFNVLIALLLMELGVYKALEQTLALYSNVADRLDRRAGRRSRRSTSRSASARRGIEFKRAHLYDINPVGVGAMLLATVVSIARSTALFGPTAKALAPFVALASPSSPRR